MTLLFERLRESKVSENSYKSACVALDRYIARASILVSNVTGTREQAIKVKFYILLMFIDRIFI